MMEISITEMFLLLWAVLATAAAFYFSTQFSTISKLLYLLSTNKEMRKDFFTRFDTLFGDTT